MESLAASLPEDGPTPKRFGEKENDEVIWATGAFVHGGVVGVLNNTKKYPKATKVFLNYLKQQCPGFRCNSIAAFKGIRAEPHRDVHNVGINAVVPLSEFEGCDIIVKRQGGDVTLKVSEGPQFFDPHEEHYTTSCTKGTSLILVGYSIRDSAKLKAAAIDYLDEVGFEWEPHRTNVEGGSQQDQDARLAMMKAEVLTKKEKNKDDGLSLVNNDLEIAIQDMEDRALRLRDLLEEEEIMAEQAQRLGRTVRDELNDTREYVCKYLDDVHKQMLQFQALRDGIFLKAARAVDNEGEVVDYEAMLEELKGDLDVIHTVPLDQVKAVLNKWTQAIDKEIQSLFDSGTLTKITQGEARVLERAGGLKIVPSKCVFTLKPPTKPGQKCRRKCRLVICGNYIAKDEAGDQMDLYASGTSTEALRLALTLAASHQWLAAIADVTAAFLLAEWPPNMPKYGLTPPKVVRDSGHEGGHIWVVQRPLYGLRESPVIWAEFRNAKLKKLRVMFRGRSLRLRPLVSEAEVWLLKDEATGELYGILVIYVDDLMYLADEGVIKELHKQVNGLWPTSDLEWIGPNKTARYLGVEIKYQSSSKAYSISQQAYIAELLRTHNMQDAPHTQLPIPREWLEATETAEEATEVFSEGDLRAGQRAVGEALWLAMKTRPDIMYVVNNMSANVTKRPRQVARMGQRLLSYLKGTADLELVLLPAKENEPHELQCYTDASFAPYGGRSFGATVVVCGNATIAWKAGKQSFVTMSTMEAELYAAAQGYNLLESLFAVVDEIEPGVYSKVLAIDNSSAVAMCQGGAGSQRTRHLKVRAQYIREAVASGVLKVRHTPGAVQLADLATKMVTKERLWELLGLWGFIGGKVAKIISAVRLKMLVFLMTLISMVKPADSQEDDDETTSVKLAGWDELLFISGCICIAAILTWELLKYFTRTMWRFYKHAKKEIKLDHVRRIAAEAARREVLEVERHRRARSPTVSNERMTKATGQQEDSSLRTRPKAAMRVTRTPSPPVRTPTEIFSPGTPGLNERPRVIRDTLDLMTVERLKQALRFLGMPTTGIKVDLIERLGLQLGHEEPGAGSAQPTTKQLKFVLYIWRKRDLQGRTVLTWGDISTRTAISEWISQNKEQN